MLEHPKAYGTHSVTIRMDATMGNQQGRVARNPPSETGRNLRLWKVTTISNPARIAVKQAE